MASATDNIDPITGLPRDGAYTPGNPPPYLPVNPATGVPAPSGPVNAAPDPYGQFSAYDPKLVDLYRKSGYMPAGQGSGFADIAYWGDKPSQWDRLAADIAGTGTDQPTGTPWGSGAWQQSGAADRAAGKVGGGASVAGMSGGGFWAPGTPTGSSTGLDTSGITDSPVIRQLILNLLGGVGGAR